MDDINEKLNTLLSDPDSMARIMQLAQQLSGGSGGQQTAAPSASAASRASGCAQHRPAAHRPVSAPYTGVFQG